MTSDEKIDKLADRVDALTQSVELLSNMHQDNEKRFERYFDLLTSNMQKLSENMNTLTRIAESHENRITNLENGQ